ncbi:MAG: hypothetical protein WC716_06495 [Chitinophagaceae bacterium]|jgi:hypothetical protein
MKIQLFIAILLFPCLNNFAQCKQRWLHFNGAKSDTVNVIVNANTDKSSNPILDISGKKIPKKFLDSVIVFLEAKENRRKENGALFLNNRIFHSGPLEIILKNVTSPSPDSAAIKFYNFSLSDGFNGSDWDENGYYFFTYTKQYGLIFKNHWEKGMNPNSYFKEILLFDECTKGQYAKDRKVVFGFFYH